MHYYNSVLSSKTSKLGGKWEGLEEKGADRKGREMEGALCHSKDWLAYWEL